MGAEILLLISQEIPPQFDAPAGSASIAGYGGSELPKSRGWHFEKQFALGQ